MMNLKYRQMILLFNPLFRTDNTHGYTQEELGELNREFRQRWHSDEWTDFDLNEAEKIFAHEVAQR